MPLVNVCVAIRAFAFREGYVDHRTLDFPGKVLVLLLVATIVLSAATALIGSP